MDGNERADAAGAGRCTVMTHDTLTEDTAAVPCTRHRDNTYAALSNVPASLHAPIRHPLVVSKAYFTGTPSRGRLRAHIANGGRLVAAGPHLLSAPPPPPPPVANARQHSALYWSALQCSKAKH